MNNCTLAAADRSKAPLCARNVRTAGKFPDKSKKSPRRSAGLSRCRWINPSERVIAEAGEDHVVRSVGCSADARKCLVVGIGVLQSNAEAAVVAVVSLVPQAGRDLLDILDVACAARG